MKENKEESAYIKKKKQEKADARFRLTFGTIFFGGFIIFVAISLCKNLATYLKDDYKEAIVANVKKISSDRIHKYSVEFYFEENKNIMYEATYSFTFAMRIAGVPLEYYYPTKRIVVLKRVDNGYMLYSTARAEILDGVFYIISFLFALFIIYWRCLLSEKYKRRKRNKQRRLKRQQNKQLKANNSNLNEN